jgi:hypothetical protein
MSKAARQRWKLLGSMAIAGQFRPTQQKGGVHEIVQLIAGRFMRGKASYQCELFGPGSVSSEQRKRIGDVVQYGPHGTDGNLGQDVIRRYIAGNLARRVAPRSKRELLKAREALGGLVAPSRGSTFRIRCGRHGILLMVAGYSRLVIRSDKWVMFGAPLRPFARQMEASHTATDFTLPRSTHRHGRGW